MKNRIFLLLSAIFLIVTIAGFGYDPGDTNGDGSIDIVDALLIAQYYVGLNPQPFYTEIADVDCEGTIDIVDALYVAQYYVELIHGLPCQTSTPEPQCSIVVTFPDTNLEAAIRNEINKPVGEIYLCDVESIISLSGGGRSIYDLSGIENLTSLQSLTLSWNNISDISALAGLASLQYLGLSDNSISDISALVANSGIDDGDHVSLGNNPLSEDSINTFVPALEERGVTVIIKPFS